MSRRVVPAADGPADASFEHTHKKTEQYVAMRARAKAQQQRHVFMLGLFLVFPVGMTLVFVGETVLTSWRSELGVASFASIISGLCVLLTADYDADTLFQSSRCLLELVIGQVLAGSALIVASYVRWKSESTEQIWLATACTMPHNLWILWHRRAIKARRPGFPLFSSCLGVQVTIYFTVRLVHAAARVTVWDAYEAAPIAILLLGVLVLLRIVLSDRPQCRGRLGCATASTATPTVRAVMCTCVTVCIGTFIANAQLLFHPEAARREVRTPVLYTVFVILPMLLAYHRRRFFYGAVAKLFERRHRLQDGVFVASMLDSEPLRVGDRWWVPGAAREKYIGIEPPPWFRGVVRSIGPASFVVEIPTTVVLPPDVERQRVVPAHFAGNAAELYRCACNSLFQMELASVTLELLDPVHSMGIDVLHSLETTLLRRACHPGETDWFVSHSRGDDPVRKLASLQHCAGEFEARTGRPPTLWFDQVCVHPAYKEDSLKCLPIYIQSCRAVLVLCSPTYFTRLWCVWELYTVFAFSEGDPSLVITMLRDSDSGSPESADNQLRDRLANFSIADAHCFDPNEERKLRRAIDMAPGGTSAFQAMIRGLAARITSSTSLLQSGIGDLELAPASAAAAAMVVTQQSQTQV